MVHMLRSIVLVLGVILLTGCDFSKEDKDKFAIECAQKGYTATSMTMVRTYKLGIGWESSIAYTCTLPKVEFNGLEFPQRNPKK